MNYVPVIGPDPIEFRVGDVYDDRYCKIINIYRFKDEENVKVRDRFKLQYIFAVNDKRNRNSRNRNVHDDEIVDHEPFECDYDNDSSMILVKKR